MVPDTGFVLIHSPLVGPLSWQTVGEELRKRNVDAIVPALGCASDGPPYWRRDVDSVVGALCGARSRRFVLAAHSGAGPLLPALGDALGGRAAAYVFVDAALPGRGGQSRLDLFPPADAERFRTAAQGGSISAVWRQDAVLKASGVHSAELRSAFAAEVPDVPLAVYEEPLPVPASWPDAPCAYLLFSDAYRSTASEAPVRDWPCRTLTGGHFHMLADPVAVAGALLNLAEEMGVR